MDAGERIVAHVVSIWREALKFMTVGGREGMLVLTERHISFVHKTDAKMRWWQAIVRRQGMMLLRGNGIMNVHDGYTEEDLREDLENKKNVEISFDAIREIRHEEKPWGSILYLEYAGADSVEKYSFAVAQDWVKYPAKEPTKFMKVDWEPLVDFVKRGRRGGV